MRTWTLRLATAALLLAAVPRAALAHVLPLTEEKLAASSPHVVVAVVEDAAPRWNAQGTLIVTDYTLGVEETLRGEAARRIVLTVPGGTLGDEAHFTCLSTPLALGSRYLLFLGELGRTSWTPIVGGWQGVYAEADASPSVFAGKVQAVRTLLARVPLEEEQAAPRPQAGLPAKAYDPSARVKLTARDPAEAPMRWDPMPNVPPFGGEDRKLMAAWNVYRADLFKIVANPSETWAYGNGVFDFAGFPDDEQLEAQFGERWDASTIDIVVSTSVGGHIVESDIAFNPLRDWTLDEAAATRPGGPLSFKAWLLRSLGIAWGLRSRVGISLTPVSRDSIMYLKPQQVDVATLYAEDAAAVRHYYPRGTALRDGLISPYEVQPFPIFPRYVPARPDAASVRRGDSVSIGAITLENPGTVGLRNLNVEVSLVPDRFSAAGAILLKRFRIAGPIPTGGALKVGVGKVTVPASVAAGDYALLFVLRDPKDRNQANNRAWSAEGAGLRVTP